MRTPVAHAVAKAHLMLRLRARGLRDLTLLRALETIPRVQGLADLMLQTSLSP